jgi:hypothetical protein
MAQILQEEGYITDIYNAVVGQHLPSGDACKTPWFNYYQCFQYGKVCTSTGFQMKLCLEVCLDLTTMCNPTMSNESIVSYCLGVSAPNGTECFGRYGVNGMRPRTTTTTTTTPAPTTTTPAPTFPTTSEICKNTYSGLTTCAVVNGYPTQETDMERILSHEFGIPYEFNIVPATSMNKSDACRALYYDYRCLQYALPCTSTGGPLKICYDTCVRMIRTCYSEQSAANIHTSCKDITAPDWTQCSISTGILNCGPNSNSTFGRTPPSLSACKCNAGFYGTYGLCTPCPANSKSIVGTTDISDCVCISGHEYRS